MQSFCDKPPPPPQGRRLAQLNGCVPCSCCRIIPCFGMNSALHPPCRKRRAGGSGPPTAAGRCRLHCTKCSHEATTTAHPPYCAGIPAFLHERAAIHFCSIFHLHLSISTGALHLTQLVKPQGLHQLTSAAPTFLAIVPRKSSHSMSTTGQQPTSVSAVASQTAALAAFECPAVFTRGGPLIDQERLLPLAECILFDQQRADPDGNRQQQLAAQQVEASWTKLMAQ